MARLSYVLLCVLLLSSLACAHSPSSVSIQKEGEKIEISVAHAVRDPKHHYVSNIAVYLDGKQIINQEYSGQLGGHQHAVYIIPGLSKGSEIKAVATCNRVGQKSGKIRVE